MNAAIPGKVAPEALELRAGPRAVTRLNRRTLALATGCSAAAVLGVTLWSLRPAHQERATTSDRYNVDRLVRADDFDRLPKDYAELPAKAPSPPLASPVLGPPLPGDLGPPILKAQASSAAPPAFGGANEAAQAERLAAQDAARSPVFFRGSGHDAHAAAQGGAAEVAGGPAANQTFNPMASLTNPQTGAAPNASAIVDPMAAQNGQSHKEDFLAKSGDAASRNAGSLQAPASPYTVMAGTIIPAALATGINSDLPGQVVATVTEGVFDTATGRYLLIPQGSRLIGRYDSQVAFAQRRVLLVWTRLILPDASSVALDRLPGVDGAGYAGVEDEVDQHWGRVLSGAALSTLLGIGAELATPGDQSNGNRVVIDVRQSAQDSVNQVGQEITRRNTSVQPALTIRPGFPLAVMVSKDLVLRPYQPLFFQRGNSP